MDKQLLQALDNLSVGLEMLSEALKEGKSKSDTGKTLESGNFGKSLETINTQLKSIKKDTQEILKNQQTLLAISKKKESDKKTAEIEESGGAKKEGAIKKGVTTILLIAVAVLAIGMAFKLVGKVDFISVIGLAAAIWIMSLAFERVAGLKLSIKEAFVTSIVLVMISLAITASSWIMKMITPIGITQFLTATFIAITFAVMSKYLENIFIAAFVFDKMKVSPFALIKTLVSISAAITASSWIMQFITPISIGQGITAIFISVVFSLIGYNLHKIALSVAMFKKVPGVKPKDLVTVLVGISAAITASSWILQLLIPLSFGKLVTAILISAMFLIISFNLEKIAAGVIAFKKTDVKATDLLLVLVGIAAAVTASSWILSLIVPIGLWQFVTALGITIMFAIMSYIMPELAAGIYIMEKALGKKGIFLMPLIFVAISLAIMLSSHILSLTAPIPFVELLRILVMSVVLTIATVVVGAAAFILAKYFGLTNIIKGSIAIVILALAIKEASLLISEGKYDIHPGWKWTLLSGLAIVGFGLVSWILNKLGGVTSYIKGGLSIIIISGVIMASSHILNLGKYEKYPTLKWVLGVGAGLAAFGIAAVLLGTQTLNPFFYAGLGITLLVAVTILATSRILNLGKYEKYPTLSWNLGVSAALASFGVAAILLGFNAINPFFYAGLGITLLVAKTIVGVSKILAKGKYEIPGMVQWALATTMLYTVFTPIILILGTVGVAAAAMGAIFGDKANPFKQGRSMMKDIARTIVDVAGILSKGKFEGGPKKEWAEGVGIAIGAFAPVYSMLVKGGIMGIFSGSGPSPKEFATAIRTISKGIVDSALFFAKNKTAFINGPSKEWSEGVGKAIGAFAPVYTILAAEKGLFGTGVSIGAFKKAIITITNGIIESAKIFAKNKAPFKEGNYPSEKWGRGVGAALGAFAPVFKSLSEDTGWFTSGDDVINNMVNAIVKISRAIVRVANIFTFSKANCGTYPTKKWSYNLKISIGSFVKLAKSIGDVEYNKVITTASKMAKVAKILHGGKDYFSKTIDPNYMKNMSQNMLDFNELVKKLVESEGEVGSSMSSLFGLDPVSQIANRMVTLAKGYDAMATALIKLSTAMKMLNINSGKELGNITTSIASGESKVKTERPESYGRIAGMGSDGKPKTKEKSISPELSKKNQIYYVSQQLEKVVKLLQSIDRSTSTIDEFIAEQTKDKIMSPPDITG